MNFPETNETNTKSRQRNRSQKNNQIKIMKPENTITNEKLAGWAQQDRIHELENKTIEYI